MRPAIVVVQTAPRGPWAVKIAGLGVWLGYDVQTARSVASALCVYVGEAMYTEAHGEYIVDRRAQPAQSVS